jgi:triosephosphate isomerase
MKKILIAGNWKSNMTKDEARKWLLEFSSKSLPDEVEVIIFAPFTLLDILSSYIKVNDMPIKLGAQNISPFSKGAYTGEVNSDQIKEFCSYVLIGHSERRSNFSESDEMINKKIQQAKSAGLQIIACVSNIDQVKSLSLDDLVIAYEPLDAIGTGHPKNPEDVKSFVDQIKKVRDVSVIYGGSVNPEDVKNYTSLDNVNGTLVGSESLTAQHFSALINNAA